MESPAMEGHTQECQYLWSGFGFPFFLMLFAVVSLKCNRPSVTLVTWSAGRSILKQTAEIPRHCERIWTLDHLYLVLRFSGMFSTPHPHHSEENSLLQAPIFNKLSTTRSEMAAREQPGKVRYAHLAEAQAQSFWLIRACAPHTMYAFF